MLKCAVAGCGREVTRVLLGLGICNACYEVWCGIPVPLAWDIVAVWAILFEAVSPDYPATLAEYDADKLGVTRGQVAIAAYQAGLLHYNPEQYHDFAAELGTRMVSEAEWRERRRAYRERFGP